MFTFYYLPFCAIFKLNYPKKKCKNEMKFKNKTLILGLIAILAFGLSACSQKSTKSENNLPSAKTILNKAQKANYQSMHATWDEKANGKTLQKAEAQYTTKPTIVYANVSATSNHYQMWIEGKNSYIQMKGTSTNRWFKTSAKAGTYSSFIQSFNGNLLTPFVQLNKKFKVNKKGNDYALTYKGNDKKIWNAIISDSAVTTLIGIDIDDVKPINTEIKIGVDKNYDVNDIKIASTYRDDGEKKTFTMNADQIGQIKKLSVPTEVKKNAVDLGKLGKK